MRDALTMARSWGWRPSEAVGGPITREKSEADWALAMALTLHDKDLCPGRCGGYLDETSHLDGWHESRRIVCDACRARDEDSEPLRPGELAYVVNTARSAE